MGLLLCFLTELLTRFCPNTLTARHLLQSAMQESAVEVCILLHYRFCRYAVLHAGAAEAQVCKHCLQVHSQCSTLHCVYTLHFVQCKLHTSCTNSMHNQCTGRARTSCARIMFAKCKMLLNLRCFGQSYLLCRTCQENNVCNLQLTELSSNLQLHSSGQKDSFHPLIMTMFIIAVLLESRRQCFL